MEESEIFLTVVLSDSTEPDLTRLFLLLAPPIAAAVLPYAKRVKNDAFAERDAAASEFSVHLPE